MNSWLDKKAYNDARYGGGIRKDERPNKKAFRASGFLKLHTPTIIFVVLSMIYGGHYVGLTHAGYSEVAHASFKASFAELMQLWGQLCSAIGLPETLFVTPVIEFLAVAISLFFALCAGVGGAIVNLVMTIL